MTEDGKRVYYFIQIDFYGDGRHLGVWNPDNRLRSYKSFKEAKIYQAICVETSLFDSTKAYILRGYNETDFRNVIRVEEDSEEEYYA